MPEHRAQDVESGQARPQRHPSSHKSTDTGQRSQELIARADKAITRSRKVLQELNDLLQRQRAHRERSAELLAARAKKRPDK